MPGRFLCVFAFFCLSSCLVVSQAAKTSSTPAPGNKSAPAGKHGPSEGVRKLASDQISFLNGSANTTKPAPYVKEVGRKKGDKGETLVGYEFYAPGLPKNKNYALLVWNIAGDPYPAWKDILLDNDGRALCRGVDPYPLDVWLPATKAEPKRFVLISDDGQSKAFMSATPFPIEAQDKSCKVQAQLLVPDALAVLVSGEGVHPSSVGHFVGNSEGEKQFGAIRVDATGRFYATFMPYVTNISKGTMNLELNFDNCHPKLSFPWGDDTYRNN